MKKSNATAVEKIRSHFPALTSGTVFFDNPGGTQVPLQVIWRMTDYLQQYNANHGGYFRTSSRSDAIIAETRQAMADLLGAAQAEEIVFGANMTTLTMALSRSLARWFKPGDEIVVTRLDHDANIAPWLLLAQDTGALIRWIDINEENCTLKMDDCERLIGTRTKLVAVGYASNAVGTINKVQRIVEMARAVNALTFIDAVQFVPHGPVDVRAIGCDFLACSAYKFFGPHVGILYGRHDLLDALPAYKVRPAGDQPPDKFETGTLNHEGIAGILGALEYLQQVGKNMGWTEGEKDRREALHETMSSLFDYEQHLTAYLIDQLRNFREIRVYGIQELRSLNERVPTVSFTHKNVDSHSIAQRLAQEDINVWSGHYYAVEIMRRLNLLDKGGMVRVGLTHYNTLEEIDRLIAVLNSL